MDDDQRLYRSGTDERFRAIERLYDKLEGRTEKIEENIEMSITKMGERLGRLEADFKWAARIAAFAFGLSQLILGWWLKH